MKLAIPLHCVSRHLIIVAAAMVMIKPFAAEMLAPDEQPKKVESAKSSADGKDASSQGSDARFLTGKADSIVDAKTGLEWAQADNGVDTDLAGATQFCETKGNGWRLPVVDELATLFDASLNSPCGKWTCHVSPKFRLTALFALSTPRDNANQPWIYSFVHGYRHLGSVEYRANARALCVRRS